MVGGGLELVLLVLREKNEEIIFFAAVPCALEALTVINLLV